jgi:hypothetical protein
MRVTTTGLAVALLSAGAGCKARTTDSAAAGVFSDSENGLVVIFAPDDARVCAVVCDGEAIARSYAGNQPPDAGTQCTTVMKCALESDLRPLTDAVDRCTGQAVAAKSFIDAVRAERLAGTASADAKAPCQSEVGAFIAALLAKDGTPIPPPATALLQKELTLSADTALTWLAAQGYLLDSGKAADADPTTLDQIASLKEQVVLRAVAARSASQRVSDLMTALTAMRGLTPRVNASVQVAQAAKQQKDRAAALAEQERQNKIWEDAQRRVRLAREEKQRSLATYRKLAGSRLWQCYTTGVLLSGFQYVIGGAKLYFDQDNGAFVYHQADPTTWLINDSVIPATRFTCAYDICTSVDRTKTLRLDADGQGFTTASPVVHLSALLFGC